MAKTQKNVRLSKRAIDQLGAIIKHTGMTQTEAVAAGIDRLHQEVVGQVEVKVDKK